MHSVQNLHTDNCTLEQPGVTRGTNLCTP